MKTTAIVYTAILLASMSLRAAAATPATVGGEVDYVATVLSTVGRGVDASIASRYSLTPSAEGIVGVASRKVNLAEWPTTPSAILSSLAALMANDGWKKFHGAPTTYVPVNATLPVPLAVAATRNDETLEIVITIFPDPDGTMKIGYSERHGRKLAEAETAPARR